MQTECLCSRSSHADNIIFMIGRPSASEAAPYYFNYINRVSSDDIVPVLHASLKKRCHSCAASQRKNRFIATRRKNGVSARCGAT